MREREAAEAAAIWCVNRCGATGDVVTTHEQDEHVINAIAMHAFWCWQALHVGECFDAELVRLHMPARNFWRERAKNFTAETQNGIEAAAGADARLHGFKPALDAAIERVVVAALIVRLMRLTFDAAISGHHKYGMSTTAIASAIGHISVVRHVAPAGSKGIPIAETALCFKQGLQSCGAQKGVTVAQQLAAPVLGFWVGGGGGRGVQGAG